MTAGGCAPTNPAAPHGAVFHDIAGDKDWDNDIPTCTADGCDCGRNGSMRMA